MNKVIQILPSQISKLRQKLLRVAYKCREIGYLDIDKLMAKFDADMEKEIQPTNETNQLKDTNWHDTLALI